MKLKRTEIHQTTKTAHLTVITATTNDGGFTASCTVTVTPPKVYVPVTGIELDAAEVTVDEGGLLILRARVFPEDASDPAVIWTSSDERVAQVSGGAVRGRSQGQAVITATTGDGGFTASCIVNVVLPDAGYHVSIRGDAIADEEI